MEDQGVSDGGEDRMEAWSNQRCSIPIVSPGTVP
jgi:hypothetical protein